jgi:hypothetical protein
VVRCARFSLEIPAKSGENPRQRATVLRFGDVSGLFGEVSERWNEWMLRSAEAGRCTAVFAVLCLGEWLCLYPNVCFVGVDFHWK